MTDPTHPAPDLDDATARGIYQTFLDRTTDLVFAGEVEAYLPHVALPCFYRTAAGTQVAETAEELSEDVLKITAWLRSAGVTDYYRIVRSARFLLPDRIEGFHTTYALKNAIPVIEPYSNRTILQHNGTLWQAVLSEHELTHPLYVDRPARPAPGSFSDAWHEKGGGATRDQDDALPLYQSLIDTMSAATNARDFDGWVGHFTMPHHVHYDAADHVVNEPADVFPFYEELVALMDDISAEAMIRQATYAVFASDDRLFGYHDTTMVKDGARCFGPIKSRMVFEHVSDTWKCSSVTNSLSNRGFPGGEFQPSTLLPTIRQIHERMRK